jgi:hypothetical protein
MDLSVTKSCCKITGLRAGSQLKTDWERLISGKIPTIPDKRKTCVAQDFIFLTNE